MSLPPDLIRNEQPWTPEQKAAANEAFLNSMASTDPLTMKEAADAITDYIRRSLRFIQHIPMRYFIHPANEQALARLWKEIGEKGEIELTDKMVPKCLVDEGIDSVEEGDPRWAIEEK